MGKPPERLDGAAVLCWVVSGLGGFYLLAGADPPVVVTAMAIARYSDSGPYYVFKCDRERQVVQDWDCATVHEAKELAAQHAGSEVLIWRFRA